MLRQRTVADESALEDEYRVLDRKLIRVVPKAESELYKPGEVEIDVLETYCVSEKNVARMLVR